MAKKFKGKYRIESIRKPGWDYRWNAAYFITICTKNREHFFGEIKDGQMELSKIGQLAQTYWNQIPAHFPYAQLDAFVVMLNHVHGIVIIHHAQDDHVESLHATTPQSQPLHARAPQDPEDQKKKDGKMAAISPKYGSLSSIIRSYKSAVTKDARGLNEYFAWQSKFHDNIIRDEKAYYNIQRYIRHNPQKWEEDTFKS